MKDQQSKTQLRALKEASMEVRAQFDSTILLELKPRIFFKLCRINDLLVTEKTPDQWYLDRMTQTLDKSILAAKMKKQSIYLQFVQGTGCLLKPGSLHFFEDGNIYSDYEFELDGILNEGIELEGLEISLTNKRGQSCKL
jgi:hypothetical protein